MALSNYEVLKSNTVTGLQTLVNTALDAGKVLVGSVFIEAPTPNSAKAIFAQAVANDSAAGDAITDVITVTSAELLALNGTVKTLVAAPAAGYAIVPLSATLFLDYATTAYDGIAAGEDLALRYTGTSGNIAGTIETTGFLDASADAHRVAVFSGLITPTAAAALVLHMASGNIATGDSPLKIKVRYRVIPLLT